MAALIFQCIFAIIFAFSGSFSGLVTFYCIIAWIFYLSTVLGLIVLRFKEPTLQRPFQVWSSIPIIFCGSTIFLLSISIWEKPITALLAFLYIISGIPLWYVVVHRDVPWGGKMIYANCRYFCIFKGKDI
jgi:amino acid transporter